MKIQEVIGSRISAVRKKRGLTLKALSELTEGQLAPSRIANWERAARTPGPNEAILLGKLLNVAASYLMGLTDTEDGSLPQLSTAGDVVPLLTYKQAENPEGSVEFMLRECRDDIQYAQLGGHVTKGVRKNWFALEVKDDSMSPVIHKGDVTIINPNQTPQPGNLVVAKLDNQPEVVIRQYRQLSCANGFESYELVALNQNWANLTVNQPGAATIIGVLHQVTHIYS